MRTNTAKAISFSCTDSDNDQLTAAVVEGPQHGTLGNITGNNYGGSTTYYSAKYTPAHGYTGTDSFTYRANDGTDDSDVAQISFDIVTPPPPTCKAPPGLTMRPERSAFFYLAGPNQCEDPSDDFMPTFDLRISKQPEHGTVEFGEGNSYGVEYVPVHGFRGSDSFSYIASNSGGDSEEVTQQITLDPDYNRAPNCSTSGTPILRVGQSRTLQLQCFDPDFDPVTFQLDSTGTRGTTGGVTDDPGDGPGSPFPGSRYVKYTAPAEVGDGTDQFSYSATDDRGAAAPTAAVQKFEVRPANYNTAPHCSTSPYGNQVENGKVAWIGTSCTDEERDPLTYTVITQPSHGSLTLRSSGVVNGEPYHYFNYKPTGDYVGDDSFSYRVTDDRDASTEVTEHVKVVKPQPPACEQPPDEKLRAGRDRGMMLYCFAGGGFFPGGDPSSFAIATQPEHGTVSFPQGDGKPWVLYKPDPGYEGPDSFSYKAINAAGESNVVTQHVTLSATYNRRPYCSPSFVGLGDKVRSGSSRDLQLYCWDPDGDPLTFTTSTPAHGSLGAVQPPAEGPYGPGPASVKYTPAAGYLGPDSFTLKASDGTADSEETSVYVTVVEPAANKAPTCWSGASVKVAANSSYSFGSDSFSCWDADADPISYDIVRPPEHGTLSAPDSHGVRRYTPTDPSWTGEDSFAYTASDGRSSSGQAEIIIDVTDPVAVTAGPATLPSGEPVKIENYVDDGGKSLIAVSSRDVRQFPSACMPLDVDTTIASGSGSVSNAKLVLAPADGGAAQSFDMTHGSGDSWSAHIGCVEEGELSVEWDFTENGTTTPLSKPLGGIVLIDPQGVVYDKGRYDAAVAAGTNPDDALRAAAIDGAQVELQRFTNGAWTKVPSGDPGISPNVNPQVTKRDGVFRWDVSAGRYRVVVKRDGYEDATSAAVDIPPPVTNLNVALTPAPNQEPPATGGGSGGQDPPATKPGDGGGPGDSAPTGSGPGPTQTPPGGGDGGKPPVKPKPACSGLKGTKKAQCESRQRLKEALAKCAKLKGKSKRALCAKRARARAKCDSLHGRKKSACVKRANALGTRPRKR